MLHEVRIFDGGGSLKRVVSPEEVSALMWKSEGIKSAIHPSLAPETSYGTGKCKWADCGKDFIKTRKTQLFCKGNYGDEYTRNKCYNAYSNKKTASPTFEKICRSCHKGFIGTKSRVFCNSPCLANKYANSEVPEFKNCKQCGDQFKPRSNAGKFCAQHNFQTYRDKVSEIKRMQKQSPKHSWTLIR